MIETRFKGICLKSRILNFIGKSGLQRARDKSLDVNGFFFLSWGTSFKEWKHILQYDI